MSKADETVALTEEQIKQANEAEAANWQGDFDAEDLKIPYTREVEPKPEEPKATEEVAENEDENLEVREVPDSVVTVNDPGEYKPADYSFEVTLADGKSVTVNSPEEAEKIADDADNFETPKQLLQFIRKSQRMENSLDRDKEKYEAQKEKFDEQSAEEKSRQETVNTFESEFLYLAGKGLIPKLSKELMSADWADPEVSKDKDVKVYAGIMDYLVKENAVRAKAGVKPMTSILDAFTGWQLDSEQKTQADEKKAAGEARKAAGSRVAGVSATQQGSFAPKGIAVGNPNVFKRGQAIWD